jgi:hypothetical protein
MADGKGRIGQKKEHTHWSSDLDTPSYYHRPLPRERDAIFLKEAHDPPWSTGDKGGIAREEPSQIVRIETVDILIECNGLRYFKGGNLGRKRKLDQYAIDYRVLV